MQAFFFHTLEQSFLLLPLLLGLYLSFHVLRVDDITADGSFVVGAAVFAKAILFQLSPGLALLLCILASALVGVVNSLMQMRNQMSPLLVSILLLFILASITLVFMGQPNVSLIERPTIFSKFENGFPQISQSLIRVGLLGTAGMILFTFFFVLLRSPIGLIFRAYGDQPSLLARLGLYPSGYRTLGLSISSGLSGLSGALTAQSSGYAAISMGAGQALVGIALVVLGLHLGRSFRKLDTFQKFSELVGILASVFLYFIALGGLVRMGVNPLYIRLLLCICLSVYFLFSSSVFHLFQRNKS